jgi:hypothetical protein
VTNVRRTANARRLSLDPVFEACAVTDGARQCPVPYEDRFVDRLGDHPEFPASHNDSLALADHFGDVVETGHRPRDRLVVTDGRTAGVRLDGGHTLGAKDVASVGDADVKKDDPRIAIGVSRPEVLQVDLFRVHVERMGVGKGDVG